MSLVLSLVPVLMHVEGALTISHIVRCFVLFLGTQRQIRRSLYPADSPPGLGVKWCWSGDYGNWHDYNMDATCLLETSRSRSLPTVDLSPCSLPYDVDLVRMVQRRKQTGFTRVVKRDVTGMIYLMDNVAATPVGAAMPVGATGIGPG